MIDTRWKSKLLKSNLDLAKNRKSASIDMESVMIYTESAMIAQRMAGHQGGGGSLLGGGERRPKLYRVLLKLFGQVSQQLNFAASNRRSRQ